MTTELDWIARAMGSPVTRGPRLQSLWSGYGEIYRVAAGARTAVVKSVKPPQHGADRGHLRKCRSYDVELAWYQRYASRSAARVPVLIDGTRTSDGWLFVLEDLDAAGFPQRRGDLARCIEWLARFHASFLGVAPEGLWAEGTYWHLDTRPDELARVTDRALRDAAPAIDRKLRSTTFRTLVHGDAKLANFCFGAAGMAAVDFQYVGGGCGMRDVAYLLSGERDERRLLDAYFAHLDLPDVEREWRPLYPIAAADFYRFLAGWAPDHFAHDDRGQRLVREVLASL